MDLEEFLNPRKILFFIGHTKKARGAKTYKGEYEFDYHSKIRDLFHVYLEDFRDRIADGHKLYNDIDVHFTRERIHFFRYNLREFAKSFGGRLHNTLLVELHFNSFSRPAQGREILVRKDDEELFDRAWTKRDNSTLYEPYSKRYKQTLYNRLDMSIHPSRRRGKDGIRWIGPEDRGYGNLLCVNKFLGEGSLATIFEPEFLSHESDASRPYVERPDVYAHQLAKWALNFTGICDIP